MPPERKMADDLRAMPAMSFGGISLKDTLYISFYIDQLVNSPNFAFISNSELIALRIEIRSKLSPNSVG